VSGTCPAARAVLRRLPGALNLLPVSHVPFDTGNGPRTHDTGYADAFQAGRVLLAGDAKVDRPTGFAED
jgi:hypothetical protein